MSERNDKLPNGVFLDGDWRWDMQPFQVTPETKKMAMHEQAIIDEILSKLNTEDCRM